MYQLAWKTMQWLWSLQITTDSWWLCATTCGGLSAPANCDTKRLHVPLALGWWIWLSFDWCNGPENYGLTTRSIEALPLFRDVPISEFPVALHHRGGSDLTKAETTTWIVQWQISFYSSQVAPLITNKPTANVIGKRSQWFVAKW